MRRILCYLLLGTTLFPCVEVFGQKKADKKIVLIDPGHGGSDSGAVGVNGISEKEVVLRIAKEVLRLNREMYKDTLELYSTRYTDTLISLGHRTQLAKTLKVDAYVSIHCNHAVRSQAQGIEVFLAHNSSNGSERLAEFFANGLNQKLGFKSRGVKRANFWVLKHAGDFPTVLLELGFLSNPEEAEHIGKQSSIKACALLILETLLKFLYHG